MIAVNKAASLQLASRKSSSWSARRPHVAVAAAAQSSSSSSSSSSSDAASVKAIAPTENPIGWTIQSNYGIGQGNTISMVLPKPVELPFKADGVTRMTYEEFLDSTAAARTELQLEAAKNLTNIPLGERAARGKAGAALLAVSAAAAVAAVAAHLGPGARAAAFGVPFWLGYSLVESSRQGICSIAQAGAWDVDGTGLQYIEDAPLAARIRGKVNRMYAQSVAVAGLAAAAFAALPL